MDDTWGVLSLILYGPEFIRKPRKKGKGRAIDRKRAVPFSTDIRKWTQEARASFVPARPTAGRAVESHNPSYTKRFASAICQGAPYCESIVELKKK